MRSRSPKRKRPEFNRLVDILGDFVQNSTKRQTLRKCIDDAPPSFASCTKVRESCFNEQDPVEDQNLENDCVGLQDGKSNRYHCFNQSTIANLLSRSMNTGNPPLNPLTREPFLQECSLFQERERENSSVHWLDATEWNGITPPSSPGYTPPSSPGYTPSTSPASPASPGYNRPLTPPYMTPLDFRTGPGFLPDTDRSHAWNRPQPMTTTQPQLRSPSPAYDNNAATPGEPPTASDHAPHAATATQRDPRSQPMTTHRTETHPPSPLYGPRRSHRESLSLRLHNHY